MKHTNSHRIKCKQAFTSLDHTKQSPSILLPWKLENIKKGDHMITLFVLKLVTAQASQSFIE